MSYCIQLIRYIWLSSVCQLTWVGLFLHPPTWFVCLVDLQLSTLLAWPALGLAVMETVNNLPSTREAAMKRVSTLWPMHVPVQLAALLACHARPACYHCDGHTAIYRQ